MLEEEVGDELYLQDPCLLAELEEENSCVVAPSLRSSSGSKTVVTLRLRGEECLKVISNSQFLTESISNPIDLAALAQAVAKVFYERVMAAMSTPTTTKALMPSSSSCCNEEIDSSFDVEKFMFELPESVLPPRAYSAHEKLRGRENYWNWARVITDDLRQLNLHPWLESAFAESTGLPADVRARYDSQVQQILYSSISPHLHTFIVRFDSAFEIFARLEQRFGRQKTRDLMYLYTRLENLQLHPHQPAARFLDDFADLREEFRMRVPDLDDIFFCTKLLLKLKPRYPAVVQALSDEPRHVLSFRTIRERILTAERVKRDELNVRFKYQQQQQRQYGRYDEPAERNWDFVMAPRRNFSFKRADRNGDFSCAFKQKRPRWTLHDFGPVNQRTGREERRPTFAVFPRRFNTRDERRNACYGCGRYGHRFATCRSTNSWFSK